MIERDKEKTRKRIIEALGRLLMRSGFQDIGINSLAKEAKVNKVLIYRYFGGLPEVLKAFAEEGGNWPLLTDLLGPPTITRRVPDVEKSAITLLLNFLRELRRRRPMQETLRWELIHKNELTEHLGKAREKQKVGIFEAIQLDPVKSPDADLPAVIILLQAGLSYLVLSSKTMNQYMGLDLHSNYGWKRIDKAVSALVKGYIAGFSTNQGTK